MTASIFLQHLGDIVSVVVSRNPSDFIDVGAKLLHNENIDGLRETMRDTLVSSGWGNTSLIRWCRCWERGILMSLDTYFSDLSRPHIVSASDIC